MSRTDPEVYEIENVAVSIRDDDDGEAMLTDFMRTRTKLRVSDVRKRQALATAIWQGYGRVDASWATAEEPLHYLLRTAKNLHDREYLGREIPLKAVALPPEVTGIQRRERIEWGEVRSVIASSPTVAATPLTNWSEIETLIDLGTAFSQQGLEACLPQVLERHRSAAIENRLPELPKRVERAGPRLKTALAAYMKPRKS